MVLVSCKKDQDKVAASNSLTAIWKWSYSTGGFAAHTIYPSPARMVILSFYSDSSYTVHVNTQLTQHGVYSTYFARNYRVIHFDKLIAVDKLYLEFDQLVSKIENGKLVLYDYQVSDGYGHYFEQEK